MEKIKRIIQFLSYWFLTYIFGALCIAYYMIARFFGRIPNIDGSEVKVMAPPCLSDPIYGSHKYFKRKGVKIHYVESGDPEAKVLLLLHGIPGFWFCWRKQIPAMSEYFRVIALDLRGCGDTDRPPRGGYNKGVIMDDIVYLIHSLGGQSVHVVCCEMGGYLGWELAAQYPDLVSKVAFLNAPHPSVLHHLFHLKPHYYFKYWYLLFLQIPMLAEVIISKEQSENWLHSLIEPAVKAKAITNEEIDAYKYTFTRREDWTGVINHLRQLELRPTVDALNLSVISTPTLILVGSNHPYLTVEAAYRSAELVERIKVKVVQSGSSNLQVTHCKKTNEELINFFVDVPTYGFEQKTSSLVGRVWGAVTPQYNISTTGGQAFPNGLRAAAQNTLLSTGANIAQTVWPRYKTTPIKC